MLNSSAISNTRCVRGQGVPLRNFSRRGLAVTALASRRAFQEKRSTKKETEPRQCPCGSGMQYRECCGPIVGGAWARTAPELARARFTAIVLGEGTLLANTTHPEALAAIGTKQSLRKKVDRFMRNRGAGDQPPALADCVHGQSPDDPDSWFVLLAVAIGPPGTEQIYPVAENYRKHAGRWWFMGESREFPALAQFEEFLRRYGDGKEDDSISPFYGRYDFSWFACPPRELSAAEAQKRAQWLVDNWPDTARRGWVYLDTAIDPETGLTAAEQAAQTQSLLDAMQHEALVDWDSFYFRRGRFMA